MKKIFPCRFYVYVYVWWGGEGKGNVKFKIELRHVEDEGSIPRVMFDVVVDAVEADGREGCIRLRLANGVVAA